MLADDSVNDWEAPSKILTNAEKKDYARQRITSEVYDGNPNIPKKRIRKLRFKAPSLIALERMKYLDHLGNPKQGYKWGNFNRKTKLTDIVEDSEFKLVERPSSVYVTKFKD